MRIPTVRGVIDSRVLINYRVDGEVLSRLCPSPFRPQLVEGYGIAGICLIGLKNMRPRGLPACLGLPSKNAAYRFAVQWDDEGQNRSGVYIPRRETSSRFNALIGGRLFPGRHYLANFPSWKMDEAIEIEMKSDGQQAQLYCKGRIVEDLPNDSIFPTLESCSDFFRSGSIGFSPSNCLRSVEGVELRIQDWQVEPLELSHLQSSFFENHENFPAGSITFDSALLMRSVEHEWHSRETLDCDCI